jgi:dUTP pyrophosphatase
MFKLFIKFNEDLDEDIKNYYLNYKSKYDGDSGIDLPLTLDLNVEKNGLHEINFGISCEMINLNNNQNVSYSLEPRSSISSTGLIMANSRGIIDKGYRGNLISKVRYFPILEDYNNYNTFNKGTRLFQICSPTLEPIIIEIVDNLTKTDRGDKGFGSTGTNI